MNYYVLLFAVLFMLFLVYTPGILTLSFSKLSSVLQVTFVPFALWNSTPEDPKGQNWFGAARVLGGKAMKYSQDGTEIDSSFDSVDYFFRIFGFEFEYITISNIAEKKEPKV